MGRRKKTVATPVAGQGIPAVVDPNKARTESDKAEAQADANVLKEQADNKAAVENEHKEAVQEDLQNQVDADAQNEQEADERFENLESNMEEVYGIMTALGVAELYENSKGEYFTNLNLAIDSEGGKADRVKTYSNE